MRLAASERIGIELKTTTYPRRYAPVLAAAAERAPQAQSILEIGPGLALKGFGMRTRREAPLRQLAKAGESLLRRLPFPDSWYESFETSEILDVFDPDHSGRTAITVIDINPKPLRAIQRIHGAAVKCVKLDFGRRSKELARLGPFDVVIALAVIGRIPEETRGTAVDNLISVTKPGGLIVTSHECDFEDRARDVEPTEVSGLFRRIGGA